MFGTFKVETTHGTVLAADLAAQEMVHARPETIGVNRPLVFVHANQHELIGLRHTAPAGAIVIVRRHVLAQPNAVAFTDLFGRNLTELRGAASPAAAAFFDLILATAA